MKIISTFSLTKLTIALTTAVISSSVMAATDVPLWHSLQGHNAKAFKNLVEDFNDSQSDVYVDLKKFDNAQDLNIALDKAAKNKSLPTLAHIGNTHTLDDVAKRSYIQPFYTLKKYSGLNKIDWFVASDNAYMYDAKGRLMVFPFMLEIPVMYYNLDAFKKANIVPAVPQRTWMELQGQLVQMANNGSRQCPLTSDLPVSINLENLAAVNNQLFASAQNGLKAKGLPSFSFDSTYVRHLSLMISWVRSEIMTKPDAGKQSISRFTDGKCAVLMSNSGHIGEFNDSSKLNYAISGLPYYPEVTKKPGNPFISGAGLWLIKSDKQHNQAAAKFLSWLAQPAQSAKWHQETGYLPLTNAALKHTPASYYQHLGHWRDLIVAYAKKSAPTAKGFKINNYPAIRTRFHQILDSALNGNQPAVTALNNAAAVANSLIAKK